MKLSHRTLVSIAATLLCAATLTTPGASAQAPELGQGWMPEFTLATRQILQLAEATPDDQFAWRPAPGVRSISEVYVHIAMANLLLLERSGAKLTIDRSTIPAEPEKAITTKADVIAWLKKSFDAVRTGYEAADRQAKVKLFGRETTVDGVFLRILVHNHEHMGQAIAYARMNGVKPPWSGGN
jgi:uncharacterized damage-inducible protein DinB